MYRDKIGLLCLGGDRTAGAIYWERRALDAAKTTASTAARTPASGALAARGALLQKLATLTALFGIWVAHAIGSERGTGRAGVVGAVEHDRCRTARGLGEAAAECRAQVDAGERHAAADDLGRRAQMSTKGMWSRASSRRRMRPAEQTGRRSAIAFCR
jgi:hypothetical protein